jgi:hypothetical protein
MHHLSPPTFSTLRLLFHSIFFTANVVLDAITTPLPLEVQGSSVGESKIGSPMTAPGCAIDTLTHLLKGHGANVPEEVRANACILLGQVGREDAVGVERVSELVKLKLLYRHRGRTCSSEASTSSSLSSPTLQPNCPYRTPFSQDTLKWFPVVPQCRRSSVSTVRGPRGVSYAARCSRGSACASYFYCGPCLMRHCSGPATTDDDDDIETFSRRDPRVPHKWKKHAWGSLLCRYCRHVAECQ